MQFDSSSSFKSAAVSKSPAQMALFIAPQSNELSPITCQLERELFRMRPYAALSVTTESAT